MSGCPPLCRMGFAALYPSYGALQAHPGPPVEGEGHGPTCDHGGMTSVPRFSDLPLSPALMPGLEALGYAELTPIQARALPAIIERHDVIAQAPTGSGKTAAFGLGVLQAIDAEAVRTQALVLCPTRELADQ